MKKRLLTRGILAMTLILCLGKGVVMANNYYDTTFSFNFDNGCQYTEHRAKYDTSKLSYHVTGGSAVYTITAQATNAAGAPIKTYSGYSQTVGLGSQGFLSSDIYENGYRYARIKACHLSGGPTSSGVWSPDNYNGY